MGKHRNGQSFPVKPNGPAELQLRLDGGFMGFVLMLLAHRIQNILCLFKLIASGVYLPYHEMEIMKALYLLKKSPS